jgi:YggT family protein
VTDSYFTNPLIFLVETIFGLYLLAVMLRFLLQWVRADFYNPVAQFIVKVTNPPLLPLRRLIPGIGGIDWSSIVLLLLVASIKFLAVYALKGYWLPLGVLLPLVLAELIALFLNIFFFGILIQVILSWIAPYQYNPVSSLLQQLNEPLLRPLRRLLPPAGGFDFSPLLAALLIHVSKMLLLPPLYSLAQ